MKKIVLSLMVLLVTSLFATDVSNFDIKGIKLGMNVDNVYKLFHIKPSHDYKTYVNNNRNYLLHGFYDIKLKKNSNIEDRFSEISYRYDKKIYYISRAVTYYTPVDYKKIEAAVKKKYGIPDKTSRLHGSDYYMCWGTCKKEKYGSFSYDKGKSLIILFHEKGWKNKDGTRVYLDVDFNLQDNDMKKSIWEYEKKTKLFLEKKSKEINSKIDL